MVGCHDLWSELGFQLFDLGTEVFPPGEGGFEFFGKLLVGVGGFAELFGIGGDFGRFEMVGQHRLGGFEFGDGGFDFLEFRLHRL